MHRNGRGLRLAAVLLLSACSTIDPGEYVGDSSQVLLEKASDGGKTVSYELRVRPDRAAFLNVVTDGEEEYAAIGLTTLELDKPRAEELGVRPFTALQVQSVDKAGPAWKAGIRKGDLLVAVGSTETYFNKVLQEAVEALPVGKPAEFKLRSQSSAEPRVVMIAPEQRQRHKRTVKRVPLQQGQEHNPKPYAGVVMSMFPKEYSKLIFGHDRDVVVISGVALGSPAYLAGLRAGDIIERIDGAPVESFAALMKALRERGAKGAMMKFEVRAKNGPFTADVRLADYTGSTRAWVPFVMSASSSARKSRWTVGPFGWLMGYENAYRATPMRRNAQSGHFSSLLGLIRFSWTPETSHTRLLWFIGFDN
ncbi:MAG: PDZ domain-containing protein [Planctomycetes bacterium]|nr:PDZ domain-containing protein [Planctomycetota bacterium]